MAGWLQNFFKTGKKPLSKGGTVAPRQQSTAVRRGDQPVPPSSPAPVDLPNATIIYGIGAAILYVAAFFLLLSGKWFSSIEVFCIGAILTGYALHLLKHQD